MNPTVTMEISIREMDVAQLVKLRAGISAVVAIRHSQILAQKSVEMGSDMDSLHVMTAIKCLMMGTKNISVN